MSIIAQKDNPPSRFPEKPILDSNPFWWIAKLKSRQEKAFTFELLENEVEYYVPFYHKKVRRKDNGKVRTSLLPLFLSYISFISKEPPYHLLNNKRVSTLLKVSNQERFKKQLNQIYLVNEGLIEVTPCNEIPEINWLARIKTGPLCGVIGRIIDRKNRKEIYLSVENLGNVKVTVSMNAIEILKPN